MNALKPNAFEKPPIVRSQAEQDFSAGVLDTSWLHRSHAIRIQLEEARSLTASASAVVAFAITWAPYGGAEAEDILVTFGVNRRKFLALLEDSLKLYELDEPAVQDLKVVLRIDLTRAWGAPSSTDSKPYSRRTRLDRVSENGVPHAPGIVCCTACRLDFQRGLRTTRCPDSPLLPRYKTASR